MADRDEAFKKNLLQQNLYQEKLELLYKNLIISVSASLLCAAVVLVAFYRKPHSIFLAYWFGAMVLISAFRLILGSYYSHKNVYTKKSFYLFLATTALSALLWGLAGSLLMPDNQLVEQMIAIIVLAGVTAGGVQSLQASFFSSLIYILLTLTPLCLWIFLQGRVSYTILGMSTTLYLLFLLVVSWRGNQFLDETLRLKHENIDLATNVSDKNKQLQNINQSLIEKETNLRLIHDNAPIGMAIVSLDGKWLNVNNKLCEIVGYAKAELENKTIQALTFQEDLDIDEDKQAKLLNGKVSSYQIEKRYIHKNGQLIWILTNVSLVRDKDNKPLYFISQIQDINDRKQNEKIINSLSNMNEMLQLCHDSIEAYPLITRTANDLFTGLSGGLAIINKTTDEMETVGRWGHHSLLKPSFKYTDCWGFRAGNVYEISDPNRDLICTHFESKPSGGYLCLPLLVQNEVIGILNFSADEENPTTSYQKQIINNFSEIVKLSLANIHLNEALRDQAVRDTLTGLVNRRYLYEWLPKILRHSIDTQRVLCVCMLDIDFFKRVNDEYGHEAGDEVLKFLGHFLRKNVRESDIACRFGGEEFVIILVGSGTAHAVSQMEHIRNEIKTAKIYAQNQLLHKITISVGIAEAPKHGSTITDLIRVADAALYEAKQTGRDKIVVAPTPKLETQV